MNKVRFGIIGMGNIGKFHADYLLQGKVRRGELSAVCSRHAADLGKYQPARIFNDPLELLRSDAVDAVIIATPHPLHAALGIAAFEHGRHVLVEKPIASHKADAERLLAAHQKHPRLVFGGMFQMRTEPRYQEIRARLQRGELGELVRVNWTNTDWFRTEAYYNSSEWRATWKGEGGGVLLNQCLHNLDTLQWLCGLPASVRGFCQFGRFHQIEVEDSVTAFWTWPNGATGTFVCSTGEAPGINRLEIVGRFGTLVLENNQLQFTKNAVDMTEFSRTATQGFTKPESVREELPVENAVLPHAQITQNFVDAILEGSPLIAPGAEGLHSVELANAMVFSSLLDRTLPLPMDSSAWEQKLAQLIADSKVRKQVSKTGTDDFAGSFRK
ncbi:MAG: Gfo/Idh/MocA family oxidoreductase [Verrucomicrobiota bacterium]